MEVVFVLWVFTGPCFLRDKCERYEAAKNVQLLEALKPFIICI